MRYSRWRFGSLEKLSKKDVMELYNKNALKYEAFYGWEQKPKHKAALAMAQPKPPMLDAGCGIGLLLPMLSGPTVGLDISINMLREARRRGIEHPLVLGDIEHLPFRNSSFRTIYSITVVQLSENPREAVEELGRVLKPNGRLIVSAHRATRTSSLLESIARDAGLQLVSRLKPGGDNLDIIIACEKR